MTRQPRTRAPKCPPGTCTCSTWKPCLPRCDASHPIYGACRAYEGHPPGGHAGRYNGSGQIWDDPASPKLIKIAGPTPDRHIGVFAAPGLPADAIHVNVYDPLFPNEGCVLLVLSSARAMELADALYATAYEIASAAAPTRANADEIALTLTEHTQPAATAPPRPTCGATIRGCPCNPHEAVTAPHPKGAE